MAMKIRKDAWIISVVAAFIFAFAVLSTENANGTKKIFRSLAKKKLPKYRVLNFGASVSYGATLSDRLHQAYPYLLSPSAKNLAIRGQGPSYPSMCTETMVGDGHYDLIILEFYLRANEGLDLLAKRLRQRFPNAVIVLLRKWNPMYIKNVKTGEPLKTWMYQHGFLGRLHDAEFHHYLKTHSGSEDWVYDFHEDADQLQDIIAKKYGAHIYELPKLDDPRSSIEKMHTWFANDMQHITAEGHEAIAFGIHHMLVEKQVVVEKSDELGTWGDGDFCDTWYWSGEASKSLEVSRNVRMKEFNAKSNKWALEVSNKGGAITVTNPFPENRSLDLTFMATGPPSLYPKTKVTLESERGSDHLQQRLASTELDPTVTVYKHEVHVGVTAHLGYVPPGQTRLRFQPLEESEHPFRITGYAISGKESHGTSFDAASAVVV